MAFVLSGSIPVHACVSDDVIKDYEPLKLQLELTVGVFRQRLGFKPPQPEICILVPVNKELKGANLVKRNRLLLDTVHAFFRCFYIVKLFS